MGFPDSAEVKNLPANAGDTRDVGSIPGLERYPGKKKWPRAPVFLPGKSHGQRSLEGYSPWGQREKRRQEKNRGSKIKQVESKEKDVRLKNIILIIA